MTECCMFAVSGYIGSESFLLKVAELAKDLKTKCPGLTYGDSNSVSLSNSSSNHI